MQVLVKISMTSDIGVNRRVRGHDLTLSSLLKFEGTLGRISFPEQLIEIFSVSFLSHPVKSPLHFLI